MIVIKGVEYVLKSCDSCLESGWFLDTEVLIELAEIGWN